MTLPEHLGEGGLDPVKDITVQRILYQQGEGARKARGETSEMVGCSPRSYSPPTSSEGRKQTPCAHIRREPSSASAVGSWARS